MLQNSGSQAVTPQMLSKFARTARQRIRLEGGGYRRDHRRALAQRVEVADGEVRIMGSKSRLLQVLTGKNGINSVPTQGLKWRREWDSNPRYALTHTRFPSVRLKPLGHPSDTGRTIAAGRHQSRIRRPSSTPPKKQIAGSQPCRTGASASCPPSAFPITCACGKCRRHSISQSHPSIRHRSSRGR